MIGDYKLKGSETHEAVKYSLSTTNLAPNGLCDHQELKTKMTVQWRLHVCVSAFMCGGGPCLPGFLSLYMCV